MARTMLAARLKVPAGEISIGYGATGKPYTLGAYFSISHSGNFVVCAVDTFEIGVDVEPLYELDLRLAKACCSGAEREYLASLEPEARGYYLLRLWVLKEAAIKCLGQDLRHMAEHEFLVRPDGRLGSLDKALDFQLCRRPEGCLLAICRRAAH